MCLCVWHHLLFFLRNYFHAQYWPTFAWATALRCWLSSAPLQRTVSGLEVDLGLEVVEKVGCENSLQTIHFFFFLSCFSHEYQPYKHAQQELVAVREQNVDQTAGE
jgi:hypothetical protein